MPHRPDLEGRREWLEDERPQPEDWWWDQDNVLIVMLPGDAGLARLQGWQVTGPKEAPTVRPSILQHSRLYGNRIIEEWHGFLTNGNWERC